MRIAALTTSQKHRRSAPRGFTLVEMVVVMGLIVLLLVLGASTFSFLTGSRSIQGAQNVLESMLSQARLRAVNTPEQTGVAIYFDTATDRNFAVLVHFSGGLGGTEDPYDNYKPWDGSFAYTQGQRVVWVANDSNSSPQNNRPSSLIFERNANASGTVVGSPPTTVNSAAPTVLGFCNNNPYWTLYTGVDLDVVPDADPQPLPGGVGVRLINDYVRTVTGSTTPVWYARYVPLGVIMFDAQGRMECVPYDIQPGTTLGNMVGLTEPTTAAPSPPAFPASVSASPNSPSYVYYAPATAAGAYSVYTDFGVALFDRAAFNAQSFATDTTYLTGQEAADTWVDQNGAVLAVDRFTGQLVQAP